MSPPQGPSSLVPWSQRATHSRLPHRVSLLPRTPSLVQAQAHTPGGAVPPLNQLRIKNPLWISASASIGLYVAFYLFCLFLLSHLSPPTLALLLLAVAVASLCATLPPFWRSLLTWFFRPGRWYGSCFWTRFAPPWLTPFQCSLCFLLLQIARSLREITIPSMPCIFSPFPLPRLRESS